MSKTFRYAYIRKKIRPTKDAVIPVQAKVVQYGIGCFTGMRGFWDAKRKNVYVFRMRDHYKRIKDSAKITGMKFNLSYVKFEKIIKDLIKKNKIKEDLYVRVTLYAGTTELTPRFDNDGDDVAIYIISLKNYFKSPGGLNICVSSWRRLDDDSISSKAKITGAYANSAMAKTEAVKNGYDEAIFLNRDGNVCEASSANIFGLRDGILYTPPLYANNLDGITRRSVIQICKERLDIPLKEEEIDRSMLYTFDELFFTGSAAKVTWIKKVDNRVIGSGKIGKTTKKIQEAFDLVTTCQDDEYASWCTQIY